MDPRSFSERSPGRLVQGGEDRDAYWAFVPAPLPPKLNLDDAGLWMTLSRADRAIAELSGLGRAIPNPHILVAPFLRREAVLSSRIEGTQTGIAELYAYEAGQLSLPGLDTGAKREDAREVANYVVALQHGIASLPGLPVSLRLIRELHALLMAGVRGEDKAPGRFRQVVNYIGSPDTGIGEAEFVFPPPHELPEALDAFERYVHAEGTYPPLVQLALIHYQFETIHPFVDGNGRIGRLLISLLAIAWNLLPEPLLYLSAYFQRHRSEYVSRLRAVSQRGEWREWILFFLQGVSTEALDAVARAKRLQDLQAEWRRLAQSRLSSVNAVSVVDMLFEQPTVQSGDVVRRCGVTPPTARSILGQLEELRLLERIPGSERPRRYWATEIIAAIGR